MLIATDSPFLRHPVEIPRMFDASSQYMTESTVKWSDFDFEKEAESRIILFSEKGKGSSGFLIFKLRVWEHEQSSAVGV